MLIDATLYEYGGSFYIAPLGSPKPQFTAGTELLDGMSLAVLFCLYAASGHRRGLEACAPTYEERDMLKRRKKHRARMQQQQQQQKVGHDAASC